MEGLVKSMYNLDVLIEGEKTFWVQRELPSIYLVKS